MRRVNNPNSPVKRINGNYNVTNRRQGKQFLGGYGYDNTSNSNGKSKQRHTFSPLGGPGGGVGGGRMSVLVNVCHFLCSILVGILCKLRRMKTKPFVLFSVGMIIGYVLLVSSGNSESGLEKTTGAVTQPSPHEDWGKKKDAGDDENSKIKIIPENQDLSKDSNTVAGVVAGAEDTTRASNKTNNIRGSGSKPTTSYAFTKKDDGSGNGDAISGDVGAQNDLHQDGQLVQGDSNENVDGGLEGREDRNGGMSGDGDGDRNGNDADKDPEIGTDTDTDDVNELQNAGDQDGHENPYYLSDHEKLPDIHDIPPGMSDGEGEDISSGTSADADADTDGNGNNEDKIAETDDKVKGIQDGHDTQDGNNTPYYFSDHEKLPDIHEPPPGMEPDHDSAVFGNADPPMTDTDKNTDSESGAQIVINDDMQKLIVHKQALLSSQSVPTKTTPYTMTTIKLPDSQRKKIMVTGGAGFVGSHLVDKLMMEGHEVIVVDNFFTGQKKNVEHWMKHPNFSLIVHDVTNPIMVEVDQIYHLACPASPPHYQYNPVKTIKTSTMGTINMLGLAKRVKARMLLASTSEIYGDPEVHPQPETYWGNVNTIGPRACYDEGKRVAETMMYSYRNQNNVEVRVARIFNTFGPRMHPNDGRVVSNFIIQALQDKDMTIYGNGSQTRSFQYVDDLVNGLYALMNGEYDGPVNLGNPDEYSVGDFASYIQRLTNSKSQIINLEKSQDDPTQRKPDITKAKEELGWQPKVMVEDGLKKTIEYFEGVLKQTGEIIPTGPGASKPRGAEEY